MSIDLTPQQQQALGEGGEFPPRVVNPRTSETFVLIPAEMFERVRAILEDEDEIASVRETYPLQNPLEDNTVYTTAEMVDRVMAEDDANDPHLAEWQQKYGGGKG